MEKSHVSIFSWKIPVGGREGAKGGFFLRKAGMLPPPHSAARACLPSPAPGQARPRGQHQPWCERSMVHGGNKAPGFPRQQVHPIPQALARPLGKGWKTRHTMKTPMCIQAPTLQLKVDHPMSRTNSRTVKGWAAPAPRLSLPGHLASLAFCCGCVGLFLLELPHPPIERPPFFFQFHCPSLTSEPIYAPHGAFPDPTRNGHFFL